MKLNKYSSSFYGISWRSARNSWVAQITVNKKHKYIGSSKIEEVAAVIYDDFVKKNNLDYRLNFPNPEPENLIPNTRLIRLTQGKFAIVDEEDFEIASNFEWHAKKSRNTYYVVSTTPVEESRKPHLLHHVIMGTNEMIDHINRDGLDNRKSNLRKCTNAENCRNVAPAKNKSSKYKGVSFFKKYGKFSSQIKVDGVAMVIGYYTNEVDAAIAYDSKAMELFGEFAWLNSPDESSKGATTSTSLSPPILGSAL